MLFFLFTCCFSFLFFYKSLVLKPLPIWASELRLLSLWFLKDFSLIPIIKGFFSVTHSLLTSIMSPKMKNHKSKVDSNETKSSEMSILDLPDLALECILEKLPPEGLCKMASVCTSLRDKCICDHLWEKHMKNKWSPIVGPAASREWQWFLASGKGSVLFNQGKQSASLFGYLVRLWPFRNPSKKSSHFFPIDSVMTCYLALESGKFWFPAQVYNRENGHVGFLLSCYDAELCYDQRTDTFQARYPPHGRRASTVESGVTWDRLRAPPVDTSPHNLHISDCLNELHPGDHVEIQWRRNKEFPYGWWYGAVGHLETCDGNANYCQCHKSDTLVLEFNQYAHGSRWRTTTVDRKYHREEGNEADGFYGGIRKVCNKEEICAWRKLWPTEALE